MSVMSAKMKCCCLLLPMLVTCDKLVPSSPEILEPSPLLFLFLFFLFLFLWDFGLLVAPTPSSSPSVSSSPFSESEISFSLLLARVSLLRFRWRRRNCFCSARVNRCWALHSRSLCKRINNSLTQRVLVTIQFLTIV